MKLELGISVVLAIVVGVFEPARAADIRQHVAAGDEHTGHPPPPQVSITDLGAFDARAINERGQVAGNRSGPTESHAFLWEKGTLTDLGGLPDPYGFYTDAFAINDRAQVVGFSTHHAFLWDRGVMTDLVPTGPSGASLAAAYAVNDLGQVVGNALGFPGCPSCPSQCFLWQDGTLTNLGTLGGRECFVGLSPGSGGAFRLINKRGQVVGSSLVAPQGSGTRHAFIWENGTMTDLGTLGGQNSSALAVNDRGQVVGYSDSSLDYDCPLPRLFFWERGTMIDLGLDGFYGPPGSGICEPPYFIDLNDRGQVIGNFYTSSGDLHHFLWERGTMTDLGLFYARGINNHGDVVGDDTSTGPAGEIHAFLRRNGRMTDLGTLPGGSGSGAFAINDRGQILGDSTTASGERHAVLWTVHERGPGDDDDDHDDDGRGHSGERTDDDH